MLRVRFLPSHPDTVQKKMENALRSTIKGSLDSQVYFAPVGFLAANLGRLPSVPSHGSLDSPLVNTTGSRLRIRIVLDHGRPSISGPIRSIKMYSWAQCTVQKRLLCSGDVPCVAQEEQGFGPSILSTYPLPIYLG
jgi:hypothetical protein